MEFADFLVIGGGVIGISTARELKKRYPDSKITLIEKEKECGMHASSRNSGVLHAGFYYSSDSLKAKFTKNGNELMTEYCELKEIPINKCGKLVVAKNKDELPLLAELLKRGRANGVELKEITSDEARLIEPRVQTYKKAIFSPTTSTVNPLNVMKSMYKDAVHEGIKINCDERYLKRKGDDIFTSKGVYNANYIVNAGGLYADTIAKNFGFSENYRILPFKGLYLYSSESPFSIHTNIYPVPDLKNPFLGVHFTVTQDGHLKIGPTAIPAFWREQYKSLDNFKFSEFMDIIIREMGLFMFSNFDFKRLAFDEIKKYSKTKLVSLAGELVSEIKEDDFTRWGEAGIRAQLVNIKKKSLEMDFVIEGDKKSMHILNAVSPGFTCAIPFASYVCDKIQEELH